MSGPPWTPLQEGVKISRDVTRGRGKIAVLGGAALLAVAQGASAATITVTNTHDAGPGSLRTAITKANDETNHPGSDKLKITTTGEIALKSELPVLATPMTIAGLGASQLTVTRAIDTPRFRIFTIAGGTPITLERISVKKGSVRGLQAFGGGIYNAGQLTLRSVVVAGNSAIGSEIFGGFINGGGIYNASSADLTHSSGAGSPGMP